MQTISWLALSWCLVPIVIVAAIYWRWFGTVTELAMASARMLVQLVAVGYVLVLIFAQPTLWVSLLVLLVMFVAAGFIAVRPVKMHQGVLLPAFIALLIAVSLHLAISLKLVLQLDVWYTPQKLIPLAGMYFANTMTALSLSAERFFSDLEAGADRLTASRSAFQAAMIPQINALMAVGLVALPGMMTGQILSGVSPLIAVRYQIMIMAMVLGASGVGSALLLLQLRRHH